MHLVKCSMLLFTVVLVLLSFVSNVTSSDYEVPINCNSTESVLSNSRVQKRAREIYTRIVHTSTNRIRNSESVNQHSRLCYLKEGYEIACEEIVMAECGNETIHSICPKRDANSLEKCLNKEN